jgi:hypothetical protein
MDSYPALASSYSLKRFHTSTKLFNLYTNMMKILKSCLEPGLTHKTKIYDLLRDQLELNTTVHLKH